MGGSVTKTKPDNFPKIGIKVSYLDTFIKSIGGEIVLRGLSTATLVEKILKPLLDKEETTSYCQKLLIEKDPNIGISSVVIVHSWYNVFLDVINTIQYYFNNEPDTIIWFDMFCLDLHKEISSFDEFCNSYKNAIKSFNYVVLIIPKWDQKIDILSRLWCNYELYCTENNNCKFEIAMMNEQEQAIFFKEILYDTINTIEKIRYMINCESCKCYHLYRDKLIRIIKNTIGFKNCNDSVFNLILNWILLTLTTCYDNCNDENEKIIIKYSNAHVYRLQGNFEQAESAYISVLESRKRLLGSEHESTLHTMFNLGSFYDDNDMFEKAEAIYVETLDTSKKVLTEYHPYSIGVSNNLAALYMNSPSNVGLIKVTIDQLFIHGVEDAGSVFDKQDPALIITVGDQILKTQRIQEGGVTAVFSEVFEVMANYSDKIAVQVVNMDGFGFTKAKIGSGDTKIYQAVPNIDDQVTYVIKLMNSKGLHQGICQMRLFCEPFNVSSVKLILDELSINDVEDAGSMFDKQDPALLITIGDQTLKTERIQEGGVTAVFPEVYEIESASYSDDIVVQVVNMDALGLTKAKIGYGHIKMYQAVKLLDEHINFSIELTNSYDKPQGVCNMRAFATIAEEIVIDKKGEGYIKAENLWIDCLSCQLELLGDSHADVLKTMENLAVLYHKMKKYDKVQYMYETVLEKHKIIYGLDDLITLQTMENLAAAFMHQNETKKAEPLFSFVLDCRKRKLGEDNQLTINSMEALACLYHQAKFPHAACPLFEKCLEKRKMIIGPSAPLTINVMGSLAEVYKDIGENFKAETLYLEVLQKFKEVKGDKHPATLNLHHIIAGFYAYKKGELKKAEDLIVQCFEKQKEVYGDDHHSTKHSSNALQIVRKKIEIKEQCYK